MRTRPGPSALSADMAKSEAKSKTNKKAVAEAQQSSSSESMARYRDFATARRKVSDGECLPPEPSMGRRRRDQPYFFFSFSFSAIADFTSFLINAAGRGSSTANRIVPFEVE